MDNLIKQQPPQVHISRIAMIRGSILFFVGIYLIWITFSRFTETAKFPGIIISALGFTDIIYALRYRGRRLNVWIWVGVLFAVTIAWVIQVGGEFGRGWN